MKNLWRQVLKNKSHTFINLFGLSLALTVCSFILLYIQDEWSYDKYLTGHDRILRLQPVVHAAEGEQEWATSEGFIVPSLTSMYPEIESGARLLRSENEVVFTIDTVNISQEGVIAADSTLFEVFPFEFIYGDRNTAFEKPESIVISAEVAKKFFGNTDPIGRTLVTESSVFEVTGVFKDIPSNSHFHFKVVLPLRFWFPDADHSHNMYAFYSYIRLTPSAQPEIFIREVLKGWYEKYGYQTQSKPRETTVKLSAKRIADIHLQSRAEREFESNGQLQLVWTFSAVAVLILIIATINYINLSNAMAIRRAKEVAVRKTVGASRRSLFFNFIIESYSFTLAAFVISVGAVMMLMGKFNLLTGKHFSYQTLADPNFVFTLLAAWMVLGFLSGFYPATILSSFKPVQALKSNNLAGRSGKFSLSLRRGLIVFQFAISSFMIVCSFTIHQQLKYIDTRNVGFNKNDIMVVTVPRAAHSIMQELKTEIQKLPAVESVSISSVVPGKRVVFLTVRIPALAGIKPNVPGTDDGTRDMRVLAIDHDFVKTFGLTIVEGRDFAIENPADAEGAFLLNEAAVKQFNLMDPVGTPFEYVFREQKKGSIIGVVKDFNFASIHTPVEPLVLHYQSDFFSTLSIRLKSADNVPATIADIESTWKHVADVSFKYNFLDTTYDNLYRSERVTGKVIATLTVLALLIACLGLFGIVSFFVAQRTREVGIRKVFGASQLSLFRILSNEYTFMVIVGNLIACYPSWLMSHRWLEQFSYRAEFSWFIYLIALGTSSVLAIVSIAHVIINTSKANPAAILRSE
jgi:putative ABC transport system permease protein